MQGTGKLSEKCTMKETCGSTNTNWMNGAHPEEAEGIVEREVHITRICASLAHKLLFRNVILVLGTSLILLAF